MKDPRRTTKGNLKHPLEEILFLAIASAVCGLTDWDEIEYFGKQQINWLRNYYDYKNGTPSHDTINRFFSNLNPEEFCKYFTQWVKTLHKPIEKEVIAIDGKAVKGSAEKSKGKDPLYFVSAFASENELVLAQEKVYEKSNEITVIPKLLDLIECKNTIITVDALNCQKTIAEKIIKKEADYIFALKNNHKDLYNEVVGRFERQKIDSQHIDNDFGHGRVEKRTCSVITDLTFIDSAEQWTNIKTIIKIDAERFHKATKEVQLETRYYISSLAGDACLINKSIRQHWSIENKLHWMLDINFREDESRKRKNHSTQNYSMICKIALNMIKVAKGKLSCKKQKLANILNVAERERVMGLV